MRFADLKGNDALKRVLPEMVDSGRVPHAIMFSEDDGGGAFALSIAFLQYLYCQNRRDGDSCGECPSCNRISKFIHLDVHPVFPASASRPSFNFLPEFRALATSDPYFREADLNAALKVDGKNTSITVADSRHLLEALSMTALEGGYRSVLIYLPEKMNAEAANKLLKLIEEPPARTQFLLITHNPEKVLPTIASRCQHIRVHSDGRRSQTADSGDAVLFFELMDALVSKNLLSCLETGEKIAALPSRESVKAFCRYAAENIRHIFLRQQGLGRLLSEAEADGGCDTDVQARLDRYAASLAGTFPRKALAVLDKMLSLVDRNVNLKLAATDMVDRLYNLL